MPRIRIWQRMPDQPAQTFPAKGRAALLENRYAIPFETVEKAGTRLTVRFTAKCRLPETFRRAFELRPDAPEVVPVK